MTEFWVPAVARRIGCTVEEYETHRAAGEHWCWACKRWQPENEFSRDRSRSTGLNARCRAAATEHQRATRARRSGKRMPKSTTAENVLVEVYDMLRARMPHGAIVDRIVQTMGRM